MRYIWFELEVKVFGIACPQILNDAHFVFSLDHFLVLPGDFAAGDGGSVMEREIILEAVLIRCH